MTSAVAPPKELSKLLNRRKALAVAAAVGMVGAAGCVTTSTTKAPDPQGMSVADTMVLSYTQDIEKALDHVDRKRLDAAKQAGSRGDGKPEVLKDIATGPAKSAAEEGSHGPATPAAHSATPAKPATPARANPPAPAARADTHGEPASAAPAAALPAAAVRNPAAEHAAPSVPVTSPPAAATPVARAAEPAIKPATPDLPAAPSVVSAMMNGIVVASSTESVPAVLVNPNLPVAAPPASAMGAMSAILSPASAAVPADHAAAAATAETSVDDALSVLRKNISTHPTLHTALALALLDGKGPDAELARSLSAADQKVLTDLVAALDAMKNAPVSGIAGPSERAAPLVDAAKKWQKEADLSLPCLSLANRVDSYGVFTALTPIFEQGRRHTIIIYCEVANFGSKKGDDGWFTTRLTQQESLITDDKLLVWRPNPEDVEDRSLNQRHDFYLVKKLTIPETLAAGKYTLRMDVTDTTTGKRAVQSMEIQIVAR